MTLILHQKPVNSTLKLPVITNWTPLIGYMLFKDANISALFYYKLIMEVWLGTVTVFDGSQGTLIAKSSICSPLLGLCRISGKYFLQ